MSRRETDQIPPGGRDLTLDTIWSNNVRIVQPRRGYRFGLDAVLLAHFLETDSRDRVLEIGTGSGIIAVLARALGKNWASLVAVEIQPELAGLAEQNFRLNALPNASVLREDARSLPAATAQFDLIFANPPYRQVGRGRLNPSMQKAVARHELELTLEQLVDCAERHLAAASGRLSVILPGFREADFHRRISQSRAFALRRHRYVHSFASHPPAFFLATVSRDAAAPLIEDAPLFIYRAAGEYTPEMASMLTG